MEEEKSGNSKRKWKSGNGDLLGNILSDQNFLIRPEYYRGYICRV
jgi:hypothetical protein